MLIHVLRVLLTLQLISVGTAHAQSSDEFKRLLGDFIGSAANRVIDNIKAKRAEKRRRKAIKTPVGQTNMGYCQVWKGPRLTDQEICEASRKCTSAWSCTDVFTWPSGSRTTWKLGEGNKILMNKSPTTHISIQGASCVKSRRTGNSFCFTNEPQVGRILASRPKIKVKSPVTKAKPKAPSGYEILEAQYLDSLERAQSGQTGTQERCLLGGRLINEYATDIDDGMLDLLSNQLEADGCLG